MRLDISSPYIRSHEKNDTAEPCKEFEEVKLYYNTIHKPELSANILVALS